MTMSTLGIPVVSLAGGVGRTGTEGGITGITGPVPTGVLSSKSSFDFLTGGAEESFLLLPDWSFLILLVLPGGRPGPRFFSVGWLPADGVRTGGLEEPFVTLASAAAGSSPNLMLAEPVEVAVGTGKLH